MTHYHETPGGLLVSRAAELREANAEHGLRVRLELAESYVRDLEVELYQAGWERLGDGKGREFDRDALGRATDRARAMYLKNPLLRRAVEIGALYVWGQDLAINAVDDDVELVINRFWKQNAKTLTGQQASRLLEVELQVTGNVFLALFPDPITGAVAVRQIPMEEMQRIVCNPEDRADVWYYERRWSEQPLGGGTVEERRAYYPDWRYRPNDRPDRVTTQTGEAEVRWSSPVLHVKAGGFAHWRWGMTELYAAMDWAKAVVGMLEDDATRSRALSRFAWKVTTGGNAASVAAGKTLFGTTLAQSAGETNPAPAAGAAFVRGSAGQDLDPIRIAGTTLDPDHSRPVRLMTSAAVGIPDHFYDADVGNYATSKTLDRPTELRFSERRQMWRDVLMELCQYVIDRDLAATRGILSKTLADDQRVVELSWPDLLERSITERVTAVSTASPYLSKELTARLMMQALGVEDIDGELAKLADQQDRDAPVPEQEAFVAALRDVREAIRAGAR